MTTTSLNAYLTRLFWLAITPLLLATVMAYIEVRATRTERDSAAANLAQNLATSIDQYLQTRIGALSVLAASPRADDASRRLDFYRDAQDFRESFGAHVVVADPEMNMLLNTRAPFGTALPRLPRPKGRAAAPAALETGAPAVGDIFAGPIAREPLVAIAVPGKRDGKTAFLLLGIFETRQFQQRLDRAILPAGWSLVLQDGTGAAIARRAPPGLNSATDVDAAGRFVVNSELSPWAVVLEIPRDIYRSPELETAAALALLILGATLIAVLGGRRASRRLENSVASLARTPVPGTPPPHIAEFATVRGLLDAAAQQRASTMAALRAGAEQLRFVADHAPVLIAHCDRTGRYKFVNQSYAQLFGRLPADLTGQSLRDVLGEAAYAEAAPRIAAVLAGQAVAFEVGLPVTATGPRTVYAQYAPEQDAAGYVVGFVAALLDITERKRLEEERDRLFNFSLDLLGVVGFDGYFKQLNPAWSRVLGWTLDELTSRPWLDFVHPDDRAATLRIGEALMNGQPTQGFENRYRCKDATYRWLSWSVSPIVDTQTALATVRDVTERRHAEEALAESRARLEALTRRLLEVQEAERRMVACELHDEIGGSLTAVKLNLQALRRAHTAAPDQATLQDGLALVDGALAAVRRLSLDLRPAVLDDLGLIPALKWYCARQAQRAGVAIELALDAINLKAAPQLESACYRIVQEAVTNALRHAGAHHIQVMLRRTDGRFALEITDDGGGFDATAARRRGLAGESSGLLGMEERANLLGGRLVIDAALGGGTRVRAEFALPEEGFA